MSVRSSLYDADAGTMNAGRYIEEILPLALKHGNKMLGKQWTNQQDVAKHTRIN